MTFLARRSAAWLLPVLALLALVAAPAASLTLDQAKSQGLLGEQADGYVGVVDGGSAEAKSLAKDVNQKRRQSYKEIADKRGTSVDAVAALAGAKLVDRAAKGEYVRGTTGGWVKK